LEKEIKRSRKGKTWDALTQETDWVTDPGATQPRETLYHKMVEMAWQTKMLIGKVSSEREDARRENNKEHTKLLNEILRCLSSLETITRLLTEVEKTSKPRLSGWLLNSTSTCATSITWTSRQPTGTERQHTSERLAWSPKRRRTRARLMKERGISSSWTSVWLVYWQSVGSVLRLFSLCFSFLCLL
jgi:hypothetical protein